MDKLQELEQPTRQDDLFLLNQLLLERSTDSNARDFLMYLYAENAQTSSIPEAFEAMFGDEWANWVMSVIPVEIMLKRIREGENLNGSISHYYDDFTTREQPEVKG